MIDHAAQLRAGTVGSRDRAALATLVNPATEEPLARTGTLGIDFGAALEHARTGGPALREMTFAQRGEVLRAWSKALHAHRDEADRSRIANGGNTRGDAKFDVDGAIATLAHYADLARSSGRCGRCATARRSSSGAPRGMPASTCGSRATAWRSTSTPSTSPPGAPPRRPRRRCSPACP